jgi:hypothetical protein
MRDRVREQTKENRREMLSRKDEGGKKKGIYFRQDKPRQDKTNKDKTRQDNTGQDE